MNAGALEAVAGGPLELAPGRCEELRWYLSSGRTSSALSHGVISPAAKPKS